MLKYTIGFVLGVLAMYAWALQNPNIQYVHPGDTFTLEEVDQLVGYRDRQIHMLNNTLKRKPVCPEPKITAPFLCDCSEEFKDGLMQGWKDCGAGI